MIMIIKEVQPKEYEEKVDVYKILDSYNRCNKMTECDACPANEKIAGTSVTFCDMLHQQSSYIENKIAELLHP